MKRQRSGLKDISQNQFLVKVEVLVTDSFVISFLPLCSSADL